MKTPTEYTALIVKEEDENHFTRHLSMHEIKNLPHKDGILINVHYSSLNYKDCLSASGNKGITRKYPHTPGIDAAGVIVQSNDKKLPEGTEVLITGFDLGMNTKGGFSEYIQVPAEWVIPLPENLSLKEAMALGTAGFTAALAVYRLEQLNIQPDNGPVIVTGATGGVGSIAIELLTKLGYHVTAATRDLDDNEYLTSLGAKDIISTSTLQDTSTKPLLSKKWNAAIDTLGGNVLENLIRTTEYYGAIATCGNILGPELQTSIYPFILRATSLVGISSANCPQDIRKYLWESLSTSWKPSQLFHYATEIPLARINTAIDAMLSGTHRGRTVVNCLQ